MAATRVQPKLAAGANSGILILDTGAGIEIRHYSAVISVTGTMIGTTGPIADSDDLKARLTAMFANVKNQT